MRFANSLFIYFVFYAFFTNAQDTLSFKDKFELKGYVKNMQIFTFRDLSAATTDNLIHNRLNFRYHFNDDVKIGLELRNRVFWGETVDAIDYASFVDQDQGLVDLSVTLINRPSLVLLSQIDRAWIHWSKNQWEIRIGRQRINWGTNLFWNANDLFNAYSFVDFDYEERPGTDAILVQRYFDNLSSIEVAFHPSDSIEGMIIAAKYQFNKWQYDYQFIISKWYTDYVLGMGWAGNIGNAGFKGELSYFIPENGSVTNLSASVSSDYVFANQLFLTAGFLLNSGGFNHSFTRAENLFLAPISAKNLMPSKYSFIINAGKPINLLLSSGVSLVYSPGVNSLLLMPSLTYAINNDFDFSLFVQAYWMKIASLENIGNGLYIRLKYSF